VSELAANAGVRRTGKSDSAFRTIGEVAESLDVPAHVLRFWESKFPQLKPLKRGGGRRYYRPEDILLLRHIRQCLYQEGYTIRGVQKLLGGAPAGDERIAADPDPAEPPSLFPLDAGRNAAAGGPDRLARPTRRPATQPVKSDVRSALEEIRRELLAARELLEALTRRQGGDY
jgi:DNA-binding transcriptional MerR regulator